MTNQSTTCRIVTAVLNANQARWDREPREPRKPKPPKVALPACLVNRLPPPRGPNNKNPIKAANGPQMCAVSSRTKISGGSADKVSRNRPETPVVATRLSMDPANISPGTPNKDPGNIFSVTRDMV